jgi:hypothetical protein
MLRLAACAPVVAASPIRDGNKRGVFACRLDTDSLGVVGADNIPIESPPGRGASGSVEAYAGVLLRALRLPDPEGACMLAAGSLAMGKTLAARRDGAARASALCSPAKLTVTGRRAANVCDGWYGAARLVAAAAGSLGGGNSSPDSHGLSSRRLVRCRCRGALRDEEEEGGGSGGLLGSTIALDSARRGIWGSSRTTSFSNSPSDEKAPHRFFHRSYPNDSCCCRRELERGVSTALYPARVASRWLRSCCSDESAALTSFAFSRFASSLNLFTLAWTSRSR